MAATMGSKNDPKAPRDDPKAPHDILAAEAFAMGERDRDLHHEHEPAHDVLAAEEFPMPAPAHHAVPPEYSAGASPAGPGDLGSSPATGRGVRAGALLLAGFVLARRRRRKRRRQVD